ncbi:MAG: hypothetical protein WD045_07820 [Pirellulaceae bacterium]
MLGRFSVGLGLLELAVLLSAGDCLAEGPAPNSETTRVSSRAPIWQIRAAREAELRRKTVSLDVRDEPLTRVLENVSRQLAIPIRIDDEALREAQISPDAPVTLRLKEVNGHTLLRYLLSGVGLRRIAEREGFLVTTPNRVLEIEDHVGPPQRYPVGDLIYDRHGKLDLGGLVHTIQQIANDVSWDSLGGPGRIGYHDEQLFILNTDDVHAKIKALLRTLREAKRAQREHGEKGNPITSVNLTSSSADSILTAMRTTTVSLPKTEMSLEEITRHLTEALDIPCHIPSFVYKDVERLREQKFSDQAWQKTTPERILDDIAESVRGGLLGWLVGGDDVVIVSDHAHGHNLHYPEYHRLYPVADLVTGGRHVADFNLNPWHLDAAKTAAGGPLSNHLTDHTAQHYQNLLSMLAESVAPSSWEANGGPASGWGLPGADSIVVYQSAENHELIDALLADIRAARPTESVPAEPTDEPTSPHVIRTYYPTRLGIGREVTRDYLEAVGRRIQRAIEPSSWDESPAFLDVYEGRIVVCQRSDRQARIQRLIQVCGIIGPDIPSEFP